MLELDHVSARYDGKSTKEALNDVNLTLKNEKAVVVGPNGSGKTTLLKVILGLVHNESGKVSVMGHELSRVQGEIRVSTNLAEVYRIIGGTVRDTIAVYSILKGADESEVLNTISDFGLDSILRKKIYQLSSGEQKMLGNILALSFSPSLILLDEPFDNVDQGRRVKLLRKVEECGSEILMNTHELDILPRLENWALYFIIEGRIFGRFSASQVKRLFINRGEVPGSLASIDTSFGKFSITQDEGMIPIATARNLNSIFDEVSQ